jgi:rRNA maturation RNase YbeY
MTTNIFFYNEDTKYVLVSKRKIRSWLLSVVEHEQKELGRVSYIFCSDDYLLEVNKQYLKASYYTDIITFDYTEGYLVSGDVFISVDRVKENAKLYGQKYCQEMLRVILHGVLHLCGYNDKTEQEIEQMRGKEDYYLQEFDLVD